MGFIARTFIRLVALASFVGIVLWSWNLYQHNDEGLKMAALGFGAGMVARATLLAWLRRHDDVSTFFRTKATAFIQTPLEEFAFAAPIWAAPAVGAQFGLLYGAATVPVGWAVLRGIVKLFLQRAGGETYQV